MTSSALSDRPASSDRSGSGKFDNLQALRGVACLLVVLFHLGNSESEGYGIRTGALQLFQGFGFAGVDLFFVLSGFIITYTNRRNFGTPLAVPGYLFRRLWRIYPTFWIAMLTCVLAMRYGLSIPFHELFSIEQLRHWLPLCPGPPWNKIIAPAWTLSYEVMFYVAFVWLLLVPRLLSWWLLLGWAVIVLSASPWRFTGRSAYLELVLSPFVLEFLGGCGVAWMLNRGWTRSGPIVFWSAFAWVGIAAILAEVSTSDSWLSLMSVYPIRVAIFGPASVLLVYSVACGEIHGGRIAPRWLRAIGDASYSIYLLHCTCIWIAVMYGCLMPHSKMWHIVWIGGTLLLSVIIGMIFHYLIERPLLLVTKHRRRPSRQVESVPPPVA